MINDLRNWLRKTIYFQCVLVLVIFSWVFISYSYFCFGHLRVHHHLNTHGIVDRDEPDSILVPQGSNLHYVTWQLYQRGILRHPGWFFFWAYWLGLDSLKRGEYELTSEMHPVMLLLHMNKGQVMQRTVTFIEGWTFNQMKQTLNVNPYIRHTIGHLSNALILQRLRHPARSPEGLFFPDTYFFTWGCSDQSILQAAYALMQKQLKQLWKERAKGLPYQNRYQALIVASLLEKESALAEEREKIAGVILRRLEKQMPLQIDPSVMYGLYHEYTIVLSAEDLQIDTPYNTYKHYGLPPTPIDMPSFSAIRAALHPMAGTSLYYVACGDHHVFSDTYADHREAVARCMHKVSRKAAENKLKEFLYNK